MWHMHIGVGDEGSGVGGRGSGVGGRGSVDPPTFGQIRQLFGQKTIHLFD